MKLKLFCLFIWAGLWTCTGLDKLSVIVHPENPVVLNAPVKLGSGGGSGEEGEGSEGQEIEPPWFKTQVAFRNNTKDQTITVVTLETFAAPSDGGGKREYSETSEIEFPDADPAPQELIPCSELNENQRTASAILQSASGRKGEGIYESFTQDLGAQFKDCKCLVNFAEVVSTGYWVELKPQECVEIPLIIFITIQGGNEEDEEDDSESDKNFKYFIKYKAVGWTGTFHDQKRRIEAQTIIRTQ